MNKIVFKPSFWKIATMWFIVCFAVMLVTIVQEPGSIADLQVLALGIVFVVVRGLILTVIFYLIPYFHVEVSDTDVIGPGSPFGGWNHIRIPLTNFENSKVKSTFPWLGFYSIDSDGFGKITVWWFDRKQFHRLLAAITAGRSAGISPALAAR